MPGPLTTTELSEPGIFVAAYVFDVCGEIHAWVQDLRRKYLSAEDLEKQPRPHMTLFFLGKHPGGTIEDLSGFTEEHREVRFCLKAGRIGCFHADREGDNFHLRITSDPALSRLHEIAVRHFLRAGHDLQTRYLRDRFTPHITILDSVFLDKSATERFLAESCPIAQIEVGAIYVMGMKIENEI